MTTEGLHESPHHVSTEPTITATGEAKIPIPCDVAWLHLVLAEEAKIVSDAFEQSAGRISIVLDRIRETEPRLPETVFELERKIAPIFDDEGAHEGFRMYRVVRAQMPPDSAGLLLDVAVMAGAGPGSRIAFGVRDPAAARARAIDAALGVAQGNAAAAAQSLGCQLGGLRSTTVQSALPDEFADPLLFASAQVRVVYTRTG